MKAKNAHTSTVSLGPLPWSDELLNSAYFKDFSGTRKAIQQHPGYAPHSAVETLKKSRSIFEQSVRDLLSAVAKFHQASSDRNLFGRPKRKEFEQLTLSVEKELFAACSAAKALADHARNVNNKWQVPAYSQRLQATFGDLTAFIKDLRDYVNHNRTAPVSWQQYWRIGMPGLATTFKLDRTVLKHTGNNWTDPSKRFLEAQTEDINVCTLFEGYLKQALSFQEWFVESVEKMNHLDLQDYRRCLRTLNSVESRSFWRMMIQQASAGNFDPNKYLDKYLTCDELIEFQSLANDPRAQVDYLIKVLDEYCACDDAMKTDIYRLFKVPNF